MRQPISIYVRSYGRNAARALAKVERRLRSLAGRNRGDKRSRSRESRSVVTGDVLAAALTELGLSAGDTVIVHSGISNIGKVAGGPRVIFDLIADRVGRDGNVLYPVFPFDTLMYTYLRSKPEFDVATAPSKMGALTDFALRSAGGERSVHPTHSVLAFGPRAKDFVAEHHLCPTPFTDRSPFARLVESGGKILLIGVGLNSTTSFHRTEDRMGDEFPVRVYADESFDIQCTDASGLSRQVTTRAHDPFISSVRDCEIVRPIFLREGIMREVTVGDGSVALIDAAMMDRSLEDLCRQRGLTIYGRIWG